MLVRIVVIWVSYYACRSIVVKSLVNSNEQIMDVTTGLRLAVADDGVLQAIDSGAVDDKLEGIDFLHCKNADVIASSYLSYYGPGARNDSIPLLQDIGVPTLVFSASQDEVVPGLASRMVEVENSLVTHIEIFGADHFFRDLYAYDIAVSVIEFTQRQEEDAQLVTPATMFL